MPDPSPASSIVHPTRPWRWLGPGLLVVATLLAYSNSLQAPFVYDDILAIPENPTIRRLWPIGDVLLPHANGGLTISGRPVLNLSFALNYAISGRAVWSYHLLNALIHAGAALLLFGIVRRTLRRFRIPDTEFRILETRSAPSVAASASERTAPLRIADCGSRNPDAGSERIAAESAREWTRVFDRPGLSFIVALLWALHPLQTQAVTYTVQRAESLMGFFYLLTLYAFIRAMECTDDFLAPPAATPIRSRYWLAISVAACALGMGTKEVMATAPLLVLLFDRTFIAGSFTAAWRERRGYYAALFATWIVLAALIVSTGGNRGGTVGLGVAVPWWAYGLTQFKAVAHYLALTAWPVPLVFEYGTFWVSRAADILPPALLVVPLLAATVIGLLPGGFSRGAGWRTAGFLGASFFLILAPTSLTPGTIQMIVEHRMYLPLAALLTGAVLAARPWVPVRAMVILGVGIAIGFAALTLRRNADYRSHVALWTDTVAKRPDNPRAHEGLAEAWTEAGRPDLALKHRAESIRLHPDESTYHYNLGLTQMDAGRLAEAARSFEQALRLAPTEPRTHNNLAIVMGRLGRTAEALAHYAEAVRLKPDDPQLHYNFGVALFRADRVEAAIAQYEAVLRLQPAHADAHFNLGAALVRRGRFDEAMAHYRDAVELRPDDADYRTTFAGVLLLARKPREAEAEFRRALAATPGSTEALFGLGDALAAQDRPAEAIALYERVLRSNPNHGNAHYKLGNALLEVDRVDEAAAQFEAAVRLMPDDPVSHHNLGVAYARRERWADAGREFERALKLKPDYPDARRNLEKFRALLGK